MVECPECHAANLAAALACVSCGARLVIVCPACGNTVASSARFCRSCGQRLSLAAGDFKDASDSATLPAGVASLELDKWSSRFQKMEDLQELAALQDEMEHPDVIIAEQYEVLSTLGHGGMGTVYKAHDLEKNRIVAIKAILPEYLSNPQASRRFLREAEALARLSHPNILTLFGSGKDGDMHYLVMELGGRDLERYLEHHGGKLPLPATLHVGLSVCQALEHAHRHGVVHRDLKPANVLIGRPGDPVDTPIIASTAVKVMDFGLAKVEGATPLTLPSQQLGTPQYMAPEQVLSSSVDPRTDLYAVGVILYELLTGIRPFDGKDPQAILYQHKTLEPVAPSVFSDAIPPQLERLILWLLEKDRAKRPASATDVRLALRLIGAPPA